MPMPPEVCPNCGADIPPKARVCPGCGSDEKTGWSDEAEMGGLGLPDDDFSYDDFIKEEFGGTSPKPRGIHWLWWLVAILLVAGFFIMLIHR